MFSSGWNEKTGTVDIKCLNCLYICPDDSGRMEKTIARIVLKETLEFREALEPHLRWKIDGNTYTGNYGTLPVSVRNDLVLLLLRTTKEEIPEYFKQCVLKRCGTMFMVHYVFNYREVGVGEENPLMKWPFSDLEVVKLPINRLRRCKDKRTAFITRFWLGNGGESLWEKLSTLLRDVYNYDSRWKTTMTFDQFKRGCDLKSDKR